MDMTSVSIAITALLALVQSFMGAAGITSSAVNQIIAGLTAIEPLIEKLGPLALQSIQAIIATVKAGAGNTLTDAQLDALDNISAQVDTAWDTAWANFVAAKNIKIAPAAATSMAVSGGAGGSGLDAGSTVSVTVGEASPSASTPESAAPLASAG